VAAVANVNAASTTVTMPEQDTTITATYSSQEDFITPGAVWKYHDQGQDLGTAWRNLGYNDAAWPSGPAQLGYGDGDEATVVSYGPDSKNKYITTYFRRNFNVSDPAAVSSLLLRLVRDDGAVVYINGVEVARDRMGTGPVDYLTLSPEGPVGGGGEDTFYEFSIAPTVLTTGPNVMAVEIHQQAANSSDLSFDAALVGLAESSLETADGDDDGMYDAWEVAHFGSTEAAQPYLDSDLDGAWNINEFIAGTLPGDPNSRFMIESMSGNEIFWTEQPGRIYDVYWTDNLYYPFVPIASDVAGGSYMDAEHATNGMSFYRLTVEME
jgi:hypothetical protein